MSVQNSKSLKKFQLTLEKHIYKLFTEDYWNSLFVNKEKVSGNWLAKISLQEFDVPQLKKDANIKFDHDNIKNTYEKEYTIDMYNSKVRIELNSYGVEVLKTVNNDITFKDKDGFIYTTAVDENFKLV